VAENPHTPRFRPRAPTLLEAVLVVAYGVIIGGWLPARAPDPIYQLPPVVVTTPDIPMDIAVPRTSARSPIGVDARVITAAWSPDTLPAAPRFHVRPLAATAAPSHAALGTAAAHGPARGGAAACPAIVPVGVEIPAHCRRSTPRATAPGCPPARPGSGPILCLRAED
jgi:hypothetical protein